MAKGEGLKKIHNFHIRVGLLEMYDLEPLGIVPSTALGVFYGEREQELVETCAAHPDLHILTSGNLRIINRYVPGAEYYYLGDGDKDPNLELQMGQLTLDDYQYALEEMLKIPEEKRDYIDRARIFFAQAAVDGANLLNAKSVKGLIADFGKRDSKN